MPSLWDRSKRQRRTPFSDLLADYLDTHRWMRPKHLANETGLSATTIQRYLNGSVTPHDPRILAQISDGTGIPLADLYQAAGIWTPAVLPSALPVEAATPPPARRVTRRQAEAQHQPQIAGRTPSTALDDAIARIRATEHPAMAEVIVQALLARAGREDPRTYWQTRIAEEHDHDAISTLLLPAIQPPESPAAQPAAQPTSQQASQPERAPLRHV